MKLFKILFSALLCSTPVFAQQHAIRWGSELFKPSSSTSVSVIGNWPDGVLMQTRTRTKLFSPGKTYLQRIDDITLNPQFNKEIKLETSRGGKPLEYEVLERLGDYPVLFATYYNKDKEKIELYGRKYSLEGEPVEREKKIAEFPASRKSRLEALNFVQSADSTKMLAFFSERFDKYSNEKITFSLFDDSLQQRWERSIEFPYKGRNFEIHKTRVGADGRVFMLVRIQYEKGELSNRQGPRFRYGLVTFDGTSVVEDYDITLEENFISDISFSIGDDGNVLCAGFYSPRGINRAAGTFLLKINRSLEAVTDKHLSEFDPQFAARFEAGFRIRNKPELTDFKLDQMIFFEDGNIGLIAEQFLIDQICYQDFRTGMFNCNYLYYHNNIIVVNISSEGRINWAADIPKFQESTNDDGVYSSYAFARSGNNLYFLFNDHPKNNTVKDERDMYVMNNIRRAEPVLVKLDGEGRFTRRPVGAGKPSRFYVIPRDAVQISERSILLFSGTSNKYKIGVLGLD